MPSVGLKRWCRRSCAYPYPLVHRYSQAMKPNGQTQFRGQRRRNMTVRSATTRVPLRILRFQAGIGLARCPAGTFFADKRNLDTELTWLVGLLGDSTEFDGERQEARVRGVPAFGKWRCTAHRACMVTISSAVPSSCQPSVAPRTSCSIVRVELPATRSRAESSFARPF